MKPLYETVTLNNGTKQHYLNAGRAKGKRILAAEGYTPARNPHYMIRGNACAHYNPILKRWVLE